MCSEKVREMVVQQEVFEPGLKVGRYFPENNRKALFSLADEGL